MTKRWTVAGPAFVGLLASALFAQQPQNQPNQPEVQPRKSQPGPQTQQPGASERDRMLRDAQRTDERDTTRAKSAGELQSLVSQLTVPIPDAIRTAERQAAEGKACVVEVCEWKNVQSGLNRTAAGTPARQPATPTPAPREPKEQPGAQPSSPPPGGTLDTRSQPIETPGQPSERETTGMMSAHPVVRVVCVGNNRITEVVVCGKTGEVLGTREHTTFARSVPSSRGPELTIERTISSPSERADRTAEDAAIVSPQTPTGGDVSSQTIVSQTGQPIRSGTISPEQSWSRAAQRWQKLTDVRGKDVVASSGGEDIGDVKELVIDPANGRSLYYVIEFKDRMNLGNKWYAFPVSACRLTDDAKNVILMVQTSQIQPASGFDEKTWPNMSDLQWGARTHSAYGQRPYWERDAAERMPRSEHENVADATAIASEEWNAPKSWQRASDLIGKPARNRQDEELGNVRDIVIDPDSGRILYGVLSFGGFLGLGDKLFAIPWGALDLTGDHKAFVLNVDKAQLERAEGFDKSNWPNMADERWASNTHRHYGQPRYWDSTETARRNGRNP